MDIDAGAEAGEKEAEAGGKNPLESTHICTHRGRGSSSEAKKCYRDRRQLPDGVSRTSKQVERQRKEGMKAGGKTGAEAAGAEDMAKAERR